MFKLYLFTYCGVNLYLTIGVTWRVSYKKEKLLTLYWLLISFLVFGRVRGFLFLCFVFYFFWLFILAFFDCCFFFVIDLCL